MNNRMICIIIAGVLSQACFADITPMQAMQSFVPSNAFTHYQPNPSETSFFEDETQEITTLAQAGEQAVENTAEGRALNGNLTHASKKNVLTATDLNQMQILIQTTLDEAALTCLDSRCLTLGEMGDSEFDRSAASLSGLAESSKQFDVIQIFKGLKGECRQQAFGYLNCCSQTGWGKDLRLTKCRDSEKQLGKAIEDKRVIYIGDYCAKHYPKPLEHQCREMREAYCIFSSKLARLILQEGGVKQLNLNFGTAKKVNCRGLAPVELQRIDFSKIDFSPVYTDLKLTAPTIDRDSLIQKMRQR